MTEFVTRLAPSPTGALHLGNARTFLINWALAGLNGWKTVLRVENLDSPRVKPETVAETLDVLGWLGIDWEGEALIQTDDLSVYEAALENLIELGRVYSCPLSRREIELAASAPQDGAQPSPFPPTLRPDPADRPRWRYSGTGVNYRFVAADDPIEIDDRIAGRKSFRPAAESGDFVIWTRRGTPAYQLAVVVDDLRQGVSDVVRGDDLLPSASLQTLLYRALGHEPPRWWHVPLVIGEDGRRLAKRHGDTRIAQYRERGVTPQRLVGLIAFWSGVTDRREEMSADDFRLSFDPGMLPRTPVVLTAEDHEWLH